MDLSKSFVNNHKKLNHEMFKNLLKNSLKKCLPFLSKYHILAFSQFASYYPSIVVEFFVNDLLLIPFYMSSGATQYFTNLEIRRDFINFLKSLLIDNTSQDAVEIIDILATFDIENSKIDLFLSLDICPLNLPFLTSEKDLYLFYNIFEFSSRGWKYPLKHIPNFSDSLNPLFFEIYREKNDLNSNNLNSNLFGNFLIQYENFKIDEKSFSKNNIFFYLDIFFNINKNSNYSNQMKKYLFQNISNSYLESFSKIEMFIIKKESLLSFSNLISAILSRTFVFFQYFSKKFLKNLLSFSFQENLTKIILNLIEQIKSDKNINPNLYIELLCTCLDSLSIALTINSKKLEADFENIFDICVNRDLEKIHHNEFFLKKSNSIMKNVIALKYIHGVGLGKHLRHILEFERQLKTVIGPNNDQYWDILFRISLFGNSKSNILTVFLILHHYIFTQKIFEKACIGPVLDSWRHFSSGMWSILTYDSNLFESSNNKHFLSTLFVKKNK